MFPQSGLFPLHDECGARTPSKECLCPRSWGPVATVSSMKMGKSLGKSMRNKWKPSLVVDFAKILGKHLWIFFDMHSHFRGIFLDIDFVNGIHYSTWIILTTGRLKCIHVLFSQRRICVYIYAYSHAYGYTLKALYTCTDMIWHVYIQICFVCMCTVYMYRYR